MSDVEQSEDRPSGSGCGIWSGCAVALLAAFVLLALALPTLQTPRKGRLPPCHINIKRVGVGLLNYEGAHGTFPPAYLADENGVPMHSWRVLLLPYLEDHDANDVYVRYDFNERWDGPNNSKLADEMPKIYGCPEDPSTEFGETSYVVIVGPGTLFDGARASAMRDISDGLSNTIAVFEATSTRIHWMEPRDLRAEDIDFTINQTTPGISSEHGGGANVLFADGSVHFLEDTTSAEILKAMTTRAGEESFALPFE